MRKVNKILLDIVLGGIKLLGLAGQFIWRVLRLILRPFYYIFKKVYFYLVLPLYRLYLLLLKKIGWSKSSRKRIFSLVFVNKKLVHLLILALTAWTIYGNLTAAQTAKASEEVVGRTLLARLVSDELTDDEMAEQVEEEGPAAANIDANYLGQNTFLDPQLAMNLQAEPTPIAGPDTPAETPDSDALAVTDMPEKRDRPIEYTVESGDTVSTIARKFGISVNTVLWENDLTAHSYIRPGDTLTILPESGIRYEVESGDSLLRIANKFDVDEDEIMRANNLETADFLAVGQTLIVPGASPAASRPSTAVAARPSAPAATVATAPREAAKPVYGTKMNWPTDGYTITQYYSWRHNGLDIANKTGTPIYAADAGTVELAAWNSGGYGYQVIIDHGGGKKTRYAHMSKFAIRAGDEVSKGQHIGDMGSTGRSTGPHIHFEVMISGKRYNPLNYLDY